MPNDEHIFDYMAAAEETGKQLDEMLRRIPGEMKAVLVEEWRKSAWLAELPKAAENATAATEKTQAVVQEAETATRFLTRTVKRAGFVVCLASVVIPLLTWGVAYWNLSELRRERDNLESATQHLTQERDTLRDSYANLGSLIEELKPQTDGGAELLVKADGVSVFRLPLGATFLRNGVTGDGREAIEYRKKWGK